MTKVGRNNPCPCGKTNAAGIPIKYKRCCLEDDADEPMKDSTGRNGGPPRLSRKDFIGKPYRRCSNCGHDAFGTVLIGGGRGDSYSKECFYCGHREARKLPPITKKVIYLDQHAISNMMKALNPESKSHATITKDQPFWLEIYKKLDVLLRLNLIICPDSYYHRYESLAMGADFELMQEIYEHLSRGKTFHGEYNIQRIQIREHFKSYLDGKSEVVPSTKAEDVVHGDLHEWTGGIRISVRSGPREGEIQSLLKEKKEKYEKFLPIFEDWRTQTAKKFEDWVHEEAAGFGLGIFGALRNWIKRRQTLPERFQETGVLDLEDVLPPSTNSILEDMLRELIVRGITGEDAIKKMKEYFDSDVILKVPSVRLTAGLFAALARDAALGRKDPPSAGVFYDVSAIASLLPYCDAMFVDSENAALLTTNPLKKLVDLPTKIFSIRTVEEFLSYLDSIKEAADPAHIKLVEERDGDDWATPCITILEDHKKQHED